MAKVKLEIELTEAVAQELEQVVGMQQAAWPEQNITISSLVEESLTEYIAGWYEVMREKFQRRLGGE